MTTLTQSTRRIPYKVTRLPGLAGVIALLVIGSIWFVNSKLFLVPGQQEYLPGHRVIMWNPGIPGGITDAPIQANVKDYGAVGDGKTNDLGAFYAAIEAAPNGAVLIPAGKYYLPGELIIHTNTVLRGEGSDKTHLIFDTPGESNTSLFIAPEDDGAVFHPLLYGYTAGSTTITVEDASHFQPGDYLQLIQTNDPQVMYTRPEWEKHWATDSIGQVLKIADVSGNNIVLTEPLMLSFNVKMNPRIRRMNMLERAGVEYLSITRVDKTADAFTLMLVECAYCHVRGIESSFTNRIHIMVKRGYRNIIRDNYIHDSHNFSGGYGYGVTLEYQTTHTLVENNLFHTLRHAMMVKTGAIGNVFGYNYSFDPVDVDSVPLADISLHGHYPSYNLFEGNIVNEIISSDWWGPSGPGNTFFRNQVNTVKPNALVVNDHSHAQNVIGNTLVTGQIAVAATVRDTLIYGNRLPSITSTELDPTIESLPDSLYLTAKPAFYGDLPFPSVGADSPYGVIPSVLRAAALGK
jgi:hypothetical protein